MEPTITLKDIHGQNHVFQTQPCSTARLNARLLWVLISLMIAVCLVGVFGYRASIKTEGDVKDALSSQKLDTTIRLTNIEADMRAMSATLARIEKKIP